MKSLDPDSIREVRLGDNTIVELVESVDAAECGPGAEVAVRLGAAASVRLYPAVGPPPPLLPIHRSRHAGVGID